MDTTRSEQLVRRLIAGDATAAAAIVERAAAGAAAGAGAGADPIGDDPAVLVAAALVVTDWAPLLERAAVSATGTFDRQVVAVAAAYLRGDADRALLLARDHLADHPASPLVAHLADLAADLAADPAATEKRTS